MKKKSKLKEKKVNDEVDNNSNQRYFQSEYIGIQKDNYQLIFFKSKHSVESVDSVLSLLTYCLILCSSLSLRTRFCAVRCRKTFVSYVMLMMLLHSISL